MEAYEELFIKELKPTLTKVAISGTIITKNDTHFVLDDGTGSIHVLVMGQIIPSGDYVRVFGTVIPHDAGVQLQADLIQDLSLIDKIAHRKVKEKLRNT